ncbi:MAG: hypothetical protein OXC26_04700 [Albidovulum sp.]|nr:hypothetical protein [Albidovulum sp.]
MNSARESIPVRLVVSLPPELARLAVAGPQFGRIDPGLSIEDDISPLDQADVSRCPKGSLGVSRLDGKEAEAMAAIMRIVRK